MAGAGPAGQGRGLVGAGPEPAESQGGAGQVSEGSHLLRDYPTAQLREADPEHPESVERSAGEFRVPLSREHVACPPRVPGWGSSRPVLPPRSVGVHLPPAGSFESLPYFSHLGARAGALGAIWPGSGPQPSSPPSRPELPCCAHPGGQPHRSPSGLGQHGLR